jgi:serine/threonine protein kinase/tetratricopeptide (TPR) repeat protein
MASKTSSSPQPGQAAPYPGQLAHFEIVRRLGAGGMAEVFLAKKRGAEGTYKVLVVKRILPSYGTSRRFKTMFIEEAKLATRLNHPNIVQVYDFLDAGDEGQLLSMEYVEGPDLGHLMSAAKAKGTRIPPWVAAWIIAEAAKGLHYAHEKRDEGGAPLEIVHRDVSPQNVLLSFEGAVKITDFGIASAREVSEEQGVLKGKFGYMSPEQARGEKVDRRTDLYALGVIFWECLGGRPLHGGLGGEALLDIVRSGIVEPPSTYVRDIPPELEALVLKALAPRPEDRYQTGREMAAAIGRALLLKQELVDASTLEATIAQLVTRENTRPGGVSEPPPGALEASRGGRADLSNADARGGKQATAGAEAAGAGASAGDALEADAGAKRPSAIPPPLPSKRQLAPEGPREVRHVALVVMRLHGIVQEVDDREGQQWIKALDRLRIMLNDMAYKRGMRWIWTSDLEARAIAGITSNPAKAAEQAAWLALDTHEAIAGIREDLPMPLGASIGIVRGIASGTRDPDGNLVKYILHDPASFLADVLLQATPLHKSWVAGGIYRQVRRDFRWGDAPTLQLDQAAPVENLPPNMRIYALERSLSREEKEAESAGAPNDLVGRDAEKAELHAAFHAAVNAGGGGGMLTCRAITGELGIGKTALVATFLNELPPNARLVRVECSPVRMEVPLSSVAELVRDAIGATGDEPFEEVAALIARAGGGSAQGDGSNPIVARLAELATNRQGPRGDDEDAHYRRKLVVSGVRSLLAAIAMEQPLVLVIEGLQWADRASLDLFQEMLRSPDPLPILMLLVTRPDERVLPMLEGQVRIELQGLTSDEQIRLVETRLNVKEGVRQVCAELLPRVGGNPFFLLEMVDALLERGALEVRETKNVAGEMQQELVRAEKHDILGLPSTLEQLLADRLQELPSAEHAIVDWLAIAGGPLGTADLLRLTKAQDEEAIIRLCARGLCDRKGDLIDFRHPLSRDVAYLALAPGARIRMHRALGEHLAETSLARGLSAAIVARHFAKGEASPRAGEFYLEAANAARNSYQTQLAIRYFHRALQHLPPDDARRLVAHEALEAIYRVLGRRRDRVKHLESLRKVAKKIGTPKAATLALLRTARFDLDEGKLARGLPVARQAASLAHSGSMSNFEIEAEALVSELLRELGDVQGALAACDRALAACDPKVNPGVAPRARADVLRSRGVLLRRVGRVREAVDAYVDAIAVFRRVGARRQEARAKNALAYAMFVQGRYEDGIALALESIQIDLSIGGRFQLAKTLTNIGHCYARLGDMPRAQAYLKRARETHERYGDQDGRADTLIVSAEVMLEEGHLDAAEELLKDASALTAVTNNAYDTTHLGIMKAILSRAKREPKESVDHALGARRAAEQQALVAFHFYGLAIEAAARVDLGEMHSATLLATTALGAVQTLQGSEYGLEIRVLCADVLKRAASPQAPHARQLAVDYAVAVMNTIRDARLRRRFAERPIVAALFDATPVPGRGDPDASADASPGFGDPELDASDEDDLLPHSSRDAIERLERASSPPPERPSMKPE